MQHVIGNKIVCTDSSGATASSFTQCFNQDSLDQCQSIQINSSQFGIGRHFRSMPCFWSALSGIGHWSREFCLHFHIIAILLVLHFCWDRYHKGAIIFYWEGRGVCLGGGGIFWSGQRGGQFFFSDMLKIWDHPSLCMCKEISVLLSLTNRPNSNLLLFGKR